MRAILTVSFRRRGTIRAALASRASTGEIAEAGPLQPLLETALAQILFMDVPDHAAVDCAVEIAKRDGEAKHYAAFANALLRRITTEKAEILAGTRIAPMCRNGSLNAGAGYGPEQAASIAPHPPAGAAGGFDGFRASLAEIAGRMLSTGSFRLETGAAIPTLPGYAEGAFQVQDAAAPCLRASWAPNRACASLISAPPGGKTAQLVAAGADVVAVERSAQRAERLKENLARLKFRRNHRGRCRHARSRDVRCDPAGCALFGDRHHSPAPGSRLDQDLRGYSRTGAPAGGDARASAAKNLKPGGMLVYATCSLEPEEGERQVEAFLVAHPDFTRRPVTPEDGIPAEMITPAGDLRVLPSHMANEGGADGFFAARLQRRA